MLIVNFHQTITHFDLHSSDTLSLIINRRKFMPGQTFIRISHTFGFKSGIGQERTVVKFPPPPILFQFLDMQQTLVKVKREATRFLTDKSDQK